MKSNRRQFLATTGCGIPGACLLGSRPASALGKTEEGARFLLSEQGCGRATGYAEANKIVTFGDHTHVAWLDSPAEGFRVRVRTLNRTTGEWSPTSTIGEGYDNHGGGKARRIGRSINLAIRAIGDQRMGGAARHAVQIKGEKPASRNKCLS